MLRIIVCGNVCLVMLRIIVCGSVFGDVENHCL